MFTELLTIATHENIMVPHSVNINVHLNNSDTLRHGDDVMSTMQKAERTQVARPDEIPSRRFDGSSGPRIIGPRDGKFTDLGSVGVRFMIWGAETGGAFSLVEHPLPPHTRGA